MGAMTEPPLGLPDMPPVLEALAGLGREIKGIIEHDLYPCAPDVPLPDREADQGRTCPPAATSRSTWGPCGDALPHHHQPVISTE